jgi:carboxyl-terminal processing protease
MGRTTRFIALGLSGVILLYVSLGYLFGQTKQDKPYKSLTVYSEVLNEIQQDYVDQPDLHLVTVGALHGLLEALDPESSYLSPREYADWKQESQDRAKGSIGVSLSRRGYIFVISDLPDSPALKEGVKEGDIFISIAGFTTQDMSIQQAHLLLDGPPGSKVKVSLVGHRSLKPRDVELTRAIVPRPALLTSKMEDGIGYLRVATFDKGSAKQIRSKLEQFKREGVQKLILDLRECSSGETSQAIETARFFLKSGTVTTLRGQTIGTKTFSAEPGKVVWNAPVTVLMSGSTAGPAEILAAAISGNHRGDTVGSSSLGMASEQKLIPLQDGSALILTVGIYYTPGGKAILNNGVDPTVQVPPPNSQQALLDAQDIAPDPTPGKLPAPTDPVVKKAIEILQGGANVKQAAQTAAGV